MMTGFNSQRHGGTLIAMLLASALAVPAHAADRINSTSAFVTTGTAGLYNGTGFNFTPLDYKKSVQVGGIAGGRFTGRYGAKVTASVGATLGFKGGVSFSNSLTQVGSGNLSTYAGNPLGATTSAFYLTPTFSSSMTKTSVGKGQVDAYVNANIYGGANIHGKICVVFCDEGDLANIAAGKPDPYHILGYHSATNSVTFLDKNYDNVLPKDFASDTLPISARLEAINVSGTASSKSSTSFHTSQQFAGAYVDVAQAIVTAFGLPQSVLSGSILGFDYTTIAAKVGAGINATYDVYTSVSRAAQYKFSTAVERFNEETGKWNYYGTSIGLSSGQTAILRPVSAVSSLSILPTATVYTNSIATLTLDASIESHIKLLEVSGYGLHAGPLFSDDRVYSLGTIGTFSDTTANTASTVLAPLTLDFVKPNGIAAAGLAAADFAPDGVGDASFAGASDAVALDPSRSFVFVPGATSAPRGPLVGSIMLATNFNTRGCNADTIIACTFDTHFKPILQQQRLTYDETGTPVYTYATDFDTADAVTALADGAFGTQSTSESLRQLVAGLPGPGGYGLEPDLSDNSTPFTPGIPEPASWVMLVAGFGIVGVVRRRFRGTAVAA